MEAKNVPPGSTDLSLFSFLL